jgi:UDP-N-acetylmuramoyl-L-alanyl-D-glutamate--2,6-diaminopimelate ligase
MYFDEFVNAGCDYVAMETSSEAYFRHRLDDITYKAGVITNITSEHLNIHGSFENYLECKEQLFKNTKQTGICILNRDEEYYEEMKKSSNGKIYTYGKAEDSTLRIMSFQIFPHKTLIKWKYNNKEYDVESPLLGDFNVYNLSAGILICLSLGFEFENLIKNIPYIKVSGRLELLDTDTPYYVMVDYAHTPNGIKNLLNFVHTLDINRSIVVIGSAGERDYLERPIMGKTVLDNASYAIFTYEDPRSERPIDIINMLISDVKDTYTNYEIEEDRHTAIEKAINMAKEKDMVLVLGKGNETYQKLKNETIYFNDIEECLKAVEKRKEREKESVSN